MKLAVFDFDGTLISGNSFHMWVKFLFVQKIVHFRLLEAMAIVAYSLLRFGCVISHQNWKKFILLKSLSIPAQDLAVFCARLIARVRPQARIAITRHRNEGLRLVIASAAPELYLKDVSKNLRINDLIATPTPSSAPFRETAGVEKCRALYSRFGNNFEIAVMYTDHSDDLPLLRLARKKIMVCPSDKQLELVIKSDAAPDEVLHW